MIARGAFRVITDGAAPMLRSNFCHYPPEDGQCKFFMHCLVGNVIKNNCLNIRLTPGQVHRWRKRCADWHCSVARP